MADGVPITAGSGTTISTDDLGAAGHVQRVKLVDGTDGGTAAIPGDATNGLDVDVTRLPALPAGTNNIGDVDVLTVPAPLSTTGNGTAATAHRVTIASDSTGVIGLAAGGNNIGDVDIASFPAGSALGITGGGVQASALRVTLATDSTGLISVDDNAGSLTVDAPVATPVFVRLSDGSSAISTLPVSMATGPVGRGVRNDTPTILAANDGDPASLAVDKYGRLQTVPARSLPKSIQVSGSLGITTAATWDEWAVWLVPATYLFAPKVARSGVTTAATRTLIVAGQHLATFNPQTNAFTATGAALTPDFYDRLFFRNVGTPHSAVATTVTVTYTDQDGNTGNTTAGLVIPASAPVGNWYEFTLAAGDFGVRSITNVTDTANPTSGTDEIWGVRTLLEDLGPANTPHIAYLGEGLKIPAGESVVILLNAAATTAQQRFASILGDLIPA